MSDDANTADKIRLSLSKKIFLLIIFIILIVSFILYIEYNKYYPSTDDAYVNANIINVAAQASGKVSKVNVKNNQYVKNGSLLFTIDSEHYKNDVDNARANVELYEKKLKADNNDILSSKATFKEAETRMKLSNLKFHRMQALYKTKSISQESYDEALSDYKVNQAKLDSAVISITHQKLMKKIDEANLLASKSRLNQSLLSLSYTKVYASSDGYVTNFSLRPGSMIKVGDNLFSIVANKNFWVDANYKETDLNRIKIGQQADIRLDMYPSIVFHAIVESISSGSGAVFSLFPPENATGNWVKVTQRFTVRLKIVGSKKLFARLRVGASANVRITTI